jgi:hypothetical protein
MATMQNAVFYVKDLFRHKILTYDKMYIISWLFSETKIKIRNKGDDSVIPYGGESDERPK